MGPTPNKVCVVTVTYGDRFPLLEKVARSAFESGAGRIVIVDNGSDVKSREAIRELEAGSKGKVSLVRLPENRGSAGGYKAGLEAAAHCRQCDFLWLLDDDNMPRRDALLSLCQAWEELGERDKEEKFALLSLREDRKDYVKVAEGEPARKWFGRRNSFLGFHVLSLASKITKRVRAGHEDPGRNYVEKAVVPYAPYGGLFFHKKLLERIGLPDTDFHIYGDDHDLTYRITKSSGRIYLVPQSRIDDIETSWRLVGKGGGLERLLDGDESRVLYSVRNRIFFEVDSLVDNKIIYHLNRLLYTFLLWSLSKLRRQGRKFALIRKAMRDGLEGKLGKRLDDTDS